MPCWTVNESKLNLKNPDPELLRKALEQLGYTLYDKEYAARFGAVMVADEFENRTSILLMPDGSVKYAHSRNSDISQATLTRQANLVNRAYSTQVVEMTAKRFGWNVQKTAENKYQVMRRY